jgi:hypothetical protein
MVDGDSVVGFPLSALLKVVDPLSTARYVAFQTLLDQRMPNQSWVLNWPYVEGCGWMKLYPLAILAWSLWPDVAAAGWRANPPGHALEIRIQEHQVDCED